MNPTPRTPHRRDRQLARVRRVSRGVLVGSGLSSAALVGLFATTAKPDLAARETDPTATTTTTATTTPTTSTTVVPTKITSPSASDDTTPTTARPAPTTTTTTTVPATTTTAPTCYTTPSGIQNCS
jgi:cytoskeletal protein RodZ